MFIVSSWDPINPERTFAKILLQQSWERQLATWGNREASSRVTASFVPVVHPLVALRDCPEFSSHPSEQRRINTNQRPHYRSLQESLRRVLRSMSHAVRRTIRFKMTGDRRHDLCSSDFSCLLGLKVFGQSLKNSQRIWWKWRRGNSKPLQRIKARER